MNITSDNKHTIFKFEGQYGPTYSIGLSKKNKDGNYENGYMQVRFKKDVNLENKTEIYIKSAWLTFNTKDKKTYPHIFINEFETIDNKLEEGKKVLDNKKSEYEQFAEENEITEEQLPF